MKSYLFKVVIGLLAGFVFLVGSFMLVIGLTYMVNKPKEIHAYTYHDKTLFFNLDGRGGDYSLSLPEDLKLLPEDKLSLVLVERLVGGMVKKDLSKDYMYQRYGVKPINEYEPTSQSRSDAIIKLYVNDQLKYDKENTAIVLKVAYKDPSTGLPVTYTYQ